MAVAAGYPGMIQYQGDMHSLPCFVEHLFESQSWQSFLTVATIIVLAGTPCQSISRGSRLTGRTRFGLHAMPSRLWHLHHQALYKIAQRLPSSRFLFMSENVIPANQSDRQELQRTAGFESEMCAVQTDGMTRPRLAWTSVCSDLLRVDFEPDSPVFDNSRLPVPWQYNHALGLVFPTLRAVFPRLMWQYATNRGQMSEMDRRTISSCFLFHQGTLRLPTLAIWAQLMGFPQHLSSLVHTISACAGTVSFHDNLDVWTVEQCGISVYCDTCSTLLQAFGEGWNLKATTRFLTTLLATQFGPAIPKQFFLYDCPPHDCTDQCSRVRLTF